MADNDLLMQKTACTTILETLNSRFLAAEKCARFLFIGDIVGRPGQRIVKTLLPSLREKLSINFVIANAENLAGGFGITEKTFLEITNSGIDVLTLGNHWNDKPDIHGLRGKTSRIVFPQNLPNRPQGELFVEFEVPNLKKKVIVLNLLGLFAMKTVYSNPFEFLKFYHNYLKGKFLNKDYIIVCDVHAEASSEKQVMGWFLDGLAAAVVGTHTHTPTSDERILPKGTAFISDLGMTGPYNSIIGMDLAKTMLRYFPPSEKGPHEVASGPAWFCALLVEISKETNLAEQTHRIQYREENNEWTISSVGKKS